MAFYINFYYKNISYDDDIIMGYFAALPYDGDVECDFIFNRNTKLIEIYNANKTQEEILPLPIGWLLDKLENKGYLKEREN